MTTRQKTLVAALLIVALVAASCGDDPGTTETGAGDATAGGAPAAMPGEGVHVTMARANWASEYITAELYRQLLTELGYDVSNPADFEVGPADAYVAMAEGTVDFWANGWYPGHFTWHETELSDGSLIGDHITVVGEGVRGAGVQGFLVTKSWAEENGVKSMDQINTDPDLIADLDANDSNAGNGIWDVYGCEESWTCDDVINNMIEFYGWDNVAQTTAGYDAMFAEFLALVNEGKPAVIYTWLPSAYVTQAIPGTDVLWLTMHPDRVLDESNPLGIVGGENHQQFVGFTGYGAAYCTQPCQLGWDASDLHVSANRDFLDANAFLAALFPLIRPDAIDLQTLAVEQANGDGSQAHLEELAAGWLADNRDLVNGWIAEALAAVS